VTEWIFPTAFSSWSPNDDGPEDRAYKRAYASGRLTMGAEVAAFEEEFANYHGRRHCIMVNSGSSANLVAVAALSQNGLLGTGYASVPAISWATTYAPLVHFGYELAVNDVDDTWNAAQMKIGTGEVPLYVAVSILGNPAHYAVEFPLIALEDNCESLGARTVDGKLMGTFGRLSTSSFFYSHQLSAIEGGAILTDDDKLARLCRLLRNHGNEGWGRAELEEQYDFSLFGYNLRPVETHAAVAREQLKNLDEMISFRRMNLFDFLQETRGLPIVHQKLNGDKPSPFGLAFECESREARARLARALRANGVDCRLPTGGSFRKHSYGKPWADQETPRADRIHSCGMFCGNAPYPIPEKIELLVKIMRETL
jgi:CDP-6-deoxy-D-xylo-4-hexulose-3-dehydrase